MQELKREANAWASLLAVRACNRFMGQPICERLHCWRLVRIENCTPVSAAFRESFADATAEDIESERIVLVNWTERPVPEAPVKFSKGEVVMFADVPPGGCPGGPCKWAIAAHNRRFVEAAAPRE